MASKTFGSRSSGAAVLAAALFLMPAPAIAQSAPMGLAASLAWSKSNAILGAPSALQAVLAEQHAPLSAARPVRPSEYSIPRVLPAALPLMERSGEGVHSGRPDVFGSVALRVGRTPLDARWRHAERAGLGGSAERYARSLRTMSPLQRLAAVNHYVNRRVRYVEDSRQFGRPDVWATASSTLARGRGDCEDYAIAKMQMLRSAGLSERDLYLVIVRDLVRRSDHAVLVARAEGRMLLLDDGTDEVLDTERVTDYRPVLTFASYGEWTHGYRVAKAPVTLASADELVPTLGVPMDQRSRSASLLAFNTGFSR
jgi:predicted transglutaminase-like cysteine proteinase